MYSPSDVKKKTHGPSKKHTTWPSPPPKKKKRPRVETPTSDAVELEVDRAAVTTPKAWVCCLWPVEVDGGALFILPGSSQNILTGGDCDRINPQQTRPESACSSNHLIQKIQTVQQKHNPKSFCFAIAAPIGAWPCNPPILEGQTPFSKREKRIERSTNQSWGTLLWCVVWLYNFRLNKVITHERLENQRQLLVHHVLTTVKRCLLHHSVTYCSVQLLRVDFCNRRLKISCEVAALQNHMLVEVIAATPTPPWAKMSKERRHPQQQETCRFLGPAPPQALVKCGHLHTRQLAEQPHSLQTPNRAGCLVCCPYWKRRMFQETHQPTSCCHC